MLCRPEEYKQFATLKHRPWSRRGWLDQLALWRAMDLRKQEAAIRNSGTTGTWGELMYTSGATAFTALSSFTADSSLLAAGQNEQPTLPALFFFNKQGLYRSIRIKALGVLGTTGTPTYTFKLSYSTTVGSGTIGTTLSISAAITTASGVTNQQWEMNTEILCTAVGQGAGNTTLSAAGWIDSPGGFGSPFKYAMEPTTPPTATWTATLDGSLTYYLNLSVACSANNASNTVQCKMLKMYGEN